MIKDDALLGTFLAEPSFEQWRKRSSVSLEEESASKRIDRVEEMTIPSDLEDKLGYVLLSPTNRCTNRSSFVTTSTSPQACTAEDRHPYRGLAEDLCFGRAPHPEARGCSGTKHQHSAFFRASFASATYLPHTLPAVGCLLCRTHHWHPNATGTTCRLLFVSGPGAVPIVAFYRSGRLVASDKYAQDPGGGQWAMLEGSRLRFVRRRPAGYRCGICAYSASS